jgi:hypothetical protein
LNKSIILGCDNGNGGGDNSFIGGGDDNLFVGTWAGTVPGPVTMVLVMTEAKFTQKQTGAFSGSRGGTYPYSCNTATLTVTTNALQPYVNAGNTFDATVGGNILTSNGNTFTNSNAW